jgi:hypothetical protein
VLRTGEQSGDKSPQSKKMQNSNLALECGDLSPLWYFPRRWSWMSQAGSAETSDYGGGDRGLREDELLQVRQLRQIVRTTVRNRRARQYKYRQFA